MFCAKQMSTLVPNLLLQVNTKLSIISEYDCIFVGAKMSTKKQITSQAIVLFSEISGDWNPIHHTDEDAIVHCAYLKSLVSDMMGTHLSRLGTLVLNSN